MSKVAIVIGHNMRAPGAFSNIVGKEYEFWKNIAYKMKEEIPELIDIYEREPKKYYTEEMNQVLNEMNKQEYKLAVELHFNSFTNNKASGSLCLVYWKNEKSKMYAKKYLELVKRDFSINPRKVYNKLTVQKVENNKPVWDEYGRPVMVEKDLITEGLSLVQNSKFRGGYGICKAKADYILIEPFFGSNEDESLKFSVISDVTKNLIEFIRYVIEN